MRNVAKKVLVTFATLLLFLSTAALGDELTLVHRFAGENYGDNLARSLAKLAGGTPRVEIVSGSYRSSEFVELIRYGKIGLGMLSMSDVAGIEATRVFELPFLVSDRGQIVRVLRGEARFEFEEAFRREGLELLAILDGSFRVVAGRAAGAPLFKLKGARMAVMDRRSARFFGEIGLESMMVPVNEVYSAAQKGVIDLFETTPERMSMLRLAEVAENLSVTQHRYDPIWLVGGQDRIEGLPRGEAEMLREAARQLEGMSFESGRDRDEALRRTMEERGVHVRTVERDEETWLLKHGRSLYDEYATGSKEAGSLVRFFLREATDR